MTELTHEQNHDTLVLPDLNHAACMPEAGDASATLDRETASASARRHMACCAHDDCHN